MHSKCSPKGNKIQGTGINLHVSRPFLRSNQEMYTDRSDAQQANRCYQILVLGMFRYRGNGFKPPAVLQGFKAAAHFHNLVITPSP